MIRVTVDGLHARIAFVCQECGEDITEVGWAGLFWRGQGLEVVEPAIYHKRCATAHENRTGQTLPHWQELRLVISALCHHAGLAPADIVTDFSPYQLA